MNPIEKFQAERRERIAALGSDEPLQAQSRDWLRATMQAGYVYNFAWMGRPIIQYPQDMVAMQELIWATRPDLIIETGIAHGGSIILSASMLALLDLTDAVERGTPFDPRAGTRRVIGVDIDIRVHNREVIERHPMAPWLTLIEGSSIDADTVARVRDAAKGYRRVLVCLDSMHTHEHVLAELEAYAPLVSIGSYCVVFDTFVDDMPPKFFPDRPWDVGNNPKTAVKAFLAEHPAFELDIAIEHKLLVTAAPHGFLKRIA